MQTKADTLRLALLFAVTAQAIPYCDDHNKLPSHAHWKENMSWTERLMEMLSAPCIVKEGPDVVKDSPVKLASRGADSSMWDKWNKIMHKHLPGIARGNWNKTGTLANHVDDSNNERDSNNQSGSIRIRDSDISVEEMERRIREAEAGIIAPRDPELVLEHQENTPGHGENPQIKRDDAKQQIPKPIEATHKSDGPHLSIVSSRDEQPTESSSSSITRPKMPQDGSSGEGEAQDSDLAKRMTLDQDMDQNPVDFSGLLPSGSGYIKGRYMPLKSDRDYEETQLYRAGAKISPAQKAAYDQRIDVPKRPKNGSYVTNGGVFADGYSPGNGFSKRSQTSVSSDSTQQEISNMENEDSSISRRDEPRGRLPNRVGAPASKTGILKSTGETVKGVTNTIYNGQPGMIYLQKKGNNISACYEDSRNWLGNDAYRIYLPTVFFTDGDQVERCGQVATLYWSKSVGERSSGIDVAAAQVLPVTIAGECRDCYPWQIQAAPAIIDEVVKGAVYVDWNIGYWGPVLGLGYTLKLPGDNSP